MNIDEYKINGVVIGNLTTDKGKFSPKFHKILEVAKGKRAVFYSNFVKSGIAEFQKFLDNEGITYLYLDSGLHIDEKNRILHAFRDTTTFLLLHPSYTEGVSILGAEQMHILEPIALLAKKEQVIARVVRYRSHAHLPENQRRVEVYQWACEMKTMMSKLEKFRISLQKWLKISKEVFYTENYNVFPQDMTPDSLILRDESINIQNDLSLTKVFAENAEDEKIKCCIKFPNSEQENECLISKKRCSND